VKSRKIVALMVLAVLLAPALVVITPGTAAQTARAGPEERATWVDGPSVFYKPIPSTTFLYLRSESNTFFDPARLSSRNVNWLDTIPPIQLNADNTNCNGRDCNPEGKVQGFSYIPTNGPSPTQDKGAYTAIFETGPLQHDVNITGADAIETRLWVRARPTDASNPLTWTITLTSTTEATEFAKVTWLDNGLDRPPGSANQPFLWLQKIRIRDGLNDHVTISAGAQIRMEITVTDPLAGINAGSWSLHYQAQKYPSSLKLQTANALKAMVFTTDSKDFVSTFFKPLAAGPGVNNTVQFHLALKDAFQSAIGPTQASSPTFAVDPGVTWTRGVDLECTGAACPHARALPSPIVQVFFGGAPIPVASDGRTSLAFEQNGRATNPAAGGYVWRSAGATPWLDLSNAPSGVYTVKALFPALRGDDYINPQNQVNLRIPDWTFAVARQTVSIAPFDDPTTPVPDESTSHDVAPGSATTFVMAAKNLGGVWDNLTLRLTEITATGTGWSASVSGPSLIGSSRVMVGPGRTELVFVRIQPPPGAGHGANAAFRLEAESVNDPSAKASTILVTSVSNAARRDLGLLIRNPDEAILPGTGINVTLWAWNRGTTPANLSVQTSVNPDANYHVSLAQGGKNVSRAVLQNVEPGAAAPVTLRMGVNRTVPSNAGPYRVDVNVSFLEGTGSAITKPINITLLNQPGFTIRILNGIGASPTRKLEMWCPDQSVGPTQGGSLEANCPPGNPNALPPDTQVVEFRQPNSQPDFRDFVEGTWWRVWLTNTGAGRDTFTITPPNGLPNNRFENGCTVDSNNPTGVPPPEWSPPRLFIRTADGKAYDLADRPSPNTLSVDGGKTAEFYIFSAHGADSRYFCAGSTVGTIAVKSAGSNVRQTATFQAEASDQRLGGRDNPTPRESAVLLEPIERRYVGTNPETIEPVVDTSRLDPLKRIQPITKGAVDLNGTLSFKARVTHGASWGDYQLSQSRWALSNVYLNFTGVRKDLGWTVGMRFADGANDGACGGPEPVKNKFVETLVFKNVNSQTNRRETFLDREVEICVKPPTSAYKPRAGENLQFQLVAELLSPDFGAIERDALGFTAEITNLANLTLFPRCPVDGAPDCALARQPIQPGKSASYLLYVANNGSSPATGTLKAFVEEPAADRNLWGLTPREFSFSLAPHENRTFALTLTAPTSARPGVDPDAKVNVTVTFTPRTETEGVAGTLQRHANFYATIRQGGLLAIDATPASAVITPGGSATYIVNVTNTDPSLAHRVTLTSSRLPNFTSNLDNGLSVFVEAGRTTQVAYVVNAPNRDLISGRFMDVVLTARDPTAVEAFASTKVTLNVAGGQAFPEVKAQTAERIVDRGGLASYQIAITNRGSVEGTFPLEPVMGTLQSGPQFTAYVQNTEGLNITSLAVKPGEQRFVNLVVRAPNVVPEGTELPVTLRVLAPDRRTSSEATMKVRIHDYGLDLVATPSRVDVIPGVPSFFSVRVTNTGNGEDTIRLDADLRGLPGWTREFSQDQVTLLPGASTLVQLTLRSPRDQLPSPRTYTITLFGSSIKAAAANLVKDDATPVVVSVLDYRPFDVDNDGFREVFVDANRDPRDGYEEFREVEFQKTQTQLVAKVKLKNDGRTQFLLEAATNEGYRGIANIYFDPDTLYLSRISDAADLDGDGIPDYLLDLDNNKQPEKLYNLASRQLTSVIAKDFVGNGGLQFLADTDGDGRYDRFYDPAGDIITRVVRDEKLGGSVYGLDTTKAGRPTKYYDVAADRVFDAKVLGFADLVASYWYVFLALVAVLVAFLVVFLRRRRRGKAAEAPAEEEG